MGADIANDDFRRGEDPRRTVRHWCLPAPRAAVVPRANLLAGLTMANQTTQKIPHCLGACGDNPMVQHFLAAALGVGIPMMR